LAVSFRLPNLLLSAGYFIVLLALAVRSTKTDDIVRLVSFGTAFLVGLGPVDTYRIHKTMAAIVTTAR